MAPGEGAWQVTPSAWGAHCSYKGLLQHKCQALFLLIIFFHKSENPVWISVTKNKCCCKSFVNVKWYNVTFWKAGGLPVSRIPGSRFYFQLHYISLSSTLAEFFCRMPYILCIPLTRNCELFFMVLFFSFIPLNGYFSHFYCCMFTFGKEISSWPYLSSHLFIIMKFYPHILSIVSSWFLWHTCEIECREHSFLEMVEWQLNRIRNLTNVGDRGIISALSFPAHIILKKSPSLKSLSQVCQSNPSVSFLSCSHSWI